MEYGADFGDIATILCSCGQEIPQYDTGPYQKVDA